MAAEPRRRGRPRSTGNLHCDRCGMMVAKIRTHWPEGAICGACYSTATNTYGRCAHCQDHRLLPGRSPSGESLCRECAHIPTNLTCTNCGQEGERIRHGTCAVCVVTSELTEILRPSDPPDLRLHRLIRELATTSRPRSVITWIRLPAPRAILERIGNRSLELSHDAFDDEPRSPALEYFRDLLVHHRMLPARGDRHLIAFEAWLDQRIASFDSQPHISQPLERFGRWHHLKRLRAKAQSGAVSMDYPTRTAKQEITEAGKFLLWLDEEHNTSLADLRQEHIDLYWSEGTSTRRIIRYFLQYHRITGNKRRLKAPARQAQSSPLATEGDRLEAIQRVLASEQVFSGTRIAALIFLLYGTRIGRIVNLKTEAIVTTSTSMTIHLGHQPAPIPEPLIALFTDYLTSDSGTRTMNKESPWLFPSTRAGAHITANALWERLTIFDIKPLAIKNATLHDLAKELDPATLSALLGYATKTMVTHATKAGNTMSSYPQSRQT